MHLLSNERQLCTVFPVKNNLGLFSVHHKNAILWCFAGWPKVTRFYLLSGISYRASGCRTVDNLR